MPANLTLHEGDAFALGGFAHDARGHAVGLAGLGEGGAQLSEVVAVGDLDHMELERTELIGDGHRGVDLLDGAIDLQAVVVDDQAEVIERVVARKHSGLPHLALLNLAVAQQGIGAIDIAPMLSGKRHSHGSGDALAK